MSIAASVVFAQNFRGSLIEFLFGYHGREKGGSRSLVHRPQIYLGITSFGYGIAYQSKER